MSSDTPLRRVVRGASIARRARLIRFNWLARSGAAHQEPARVIGDARKEWEEARAAASGPRVLIANNLGGQFALGNVDRMLAMALTLRGAQVEAALCDGFLPACQMVEYALTPSLKGFAQSGPDPMLCGYCNAPGLAQWRQLGLPVWTLSRFVTEAERNEVRTLAHAAPRVELSTLQWRGLPIGEHAAAGALRFFARGDFEGEAESVRVLRRYVEAALLTAAAYCRLIDERKPDVMVAHHGIYVPQGIATAVARAAGVRVVTWNPAYRRHCFIFSHDDTYHHTLMTEPTSVWDQKPLSDEEAKRTRDYLISRREGDADWIKFHARPDYALDEALQREGLDPRRPYTLALTNVFWDAQVHYPADVFPSQLEWLRHTVAWFSARPQLQLCIRVHPAEVNGSPPSRQFAAAALRAAFPSWPANVALIGPDQATSTYALAERADAAIIYGTKTGVELSALGIPVIVAGSAWVRGKGFTRDARDVAHYEALLSDLPLSKRLPAALEARALAYAHHFFFRRMIELPFMTPTNGPGRFEIGPDGLEALKENSAPGLEAICSGILARTDFVMT